MLKSVPRLAESKSGIFSLSLFFFPHFAFIYLFIFKLNFLLYLGIQPINNV